MAITLSLACSVSIPSSAVFSSATTQVALNSEIYFVGPGILLKNRTPSNQSEVGFYWYPGTASAAAISFTTNRHAIYPTQQGVISYPSPVSATNFVTFTGTKTPPLDLFATNKSIIDIQWRKGLWAWTQVDNTFPTSARVSNFYVEDRSGSQGAAPDPDNNIRWIWLGSDATPSVTGRNANSRMLKLKNWRDTFAYEHRSTVSANAPGRFLTFAQKTIDGNFFDDVTYQSTSADIGHDYFEPKEVFVIRDHPSKIQFFEIGWANNIGRINFIERVGDTWEKQTVLSNISSNVFPSLFYTPGNGGTQDSVTLLTHNKVTSYWISDVYRELTPLTLSLSQEPLARSAISRRELTSQEADLIPGDVQSRNINYLKQALPDQDDISIEIGDLSYSIIYDKKLDGIELEISQGEIRPRAKKELPINSAIELVAGVVTYKLRYRRELESQHICILQRYPFWRAEEDKEPEFAELSSPEPVFQRTIEVAPKWSTDRNQKCRR